ARRPPRSDHRRGPAAAPRGIGSLGHATPGRRRTGMPDALHMLIAEDNEDDVELIRMALASTGDRCDYAIVPDGVEALAYLRRQGAYAGARPPGLVVLDLNMPHKDGLQTLQEIKADPALR